MATSLAIISPDPKLVADIQAVNGVGYVSLGLLKIGFVLFTIFNIIPSALENTLVFPGYSWMFVGIILVSGTSLVTCGAILLNARRNKKAAYDLAFM